MKMTVTVKGKPVGKWEKRKKQTELPHYELIMEWWGPDIHWGNTRFLLVRCPREKCGESFSVAANPWLAPKYATIRPDVLMRGRSCPYCMCPSLPPEEVQ